MKGSYNNWGWEVAAGSWVIQAQAYGGDAPHVFDVALFMDLAHKEKRSWVNALVFLLTGVNELKNTNDLNARPSELSLGDPHINIDFSDNAARKMAELLVVEQRD